MQRPSTKSLLLAAAALLCATTAQAQVSDAQKAAAERKPAAAAKAAPSQAAKPAEGLSAKSVKPTDQKLTPAAQSTPAPYKDEAGCHSKASDA